MQQLRAKAAASTDQPRSRGVSGATSPVPAEDLASGILLVRQKGPKCNIAVSKRITEVFASSKG